MTFNLHEIGITQTQLDAMQHPELAGLVPCRISKSHGGQGWMWGAEGEWMFSSAGRLRLDREGIVGGLPAVGDWVAARPPTSADPQARIEQILPRKSAFIRKVVGDSTREQVIAANLDTVFVLTSINRDFSLNRVERYLTLTHESGANPVVVITKTDLVRDATVQECIGLISEIAVGVPVLAISATKGKGLEQLQPYLAPQTTIAVLGSSGVGKSTLINLWMDDEIFVTQETREDGRGRHTTSHRELVILPNGSLAIDTPGMRELQFLDFQQGLTRAFSDIEELASDCKFTDCRHEQEPGCAVQDAVESGKVSDRRIESYLKLREEIEEAEQRERKHQWNATDAHKINYPKRPANQKTRRHKK